MGGSVHVGVWTFSRVHLLRRFSVFLLALVVLPFDFRCPQPTVSSGLTGSFTFEVLLPVIPFDLLWALLIIAPHAWAMGKNRAIMRYVER